MKDIYDNKVMTCGLIFVLVLIVVGIGYIVTHWAEPPETWIERAMTVTAYCPCEICCGDFADGYTASGYQIQAGDVFVAAPPSMPFGTRLMIDGYAGGLVVEVKDRGGSIKGNKLDVYFSDHNSAKAWGVREINVKVLEN